MNTVPVVRVLSLLLAVTLLSACKIKITVPAEGGTVVWSNGECAAGTMCEIEVTDQNFDDTFEAVPAPGYRFVRWKKDDGFFCGGDVMPCRLYTTSFNDHPALTPFLASDDVFHLVPEFEAQPLEISYDLEYWQRIDREVASGDRSTEDFLYDIVPDLDNCDAGDISTAASNRARAALNQLRDLHGLPGVRYDATSDNETQASSLIMNVNRTIDHSPASNLTCFTQAGFDGAATSNLSAYTRAVDPALDVINWANDNFNLGNAMEGGHRRWMLYPFLTATSYGQVDGFGSLKVIFDNVGSGGAIPDDVEFVAFPFRAYPYMLLTPGTDNPTPWSFFWIPDSPTDPIHNYFANAQVRVVHRETGEQMRVRNRYTDTRGIGTPNFLSWKVRNWEYDEIYDVTVSNIMLPGGETRTITYPVMVDRFSIVDLGRPLEAGDGRQGNTFSGNFDAQDDIDSYSFSTSGGQVTFTGESEFTNQAFFIWLYDARKRLTRVVDDAFSIDLEEGDYTLWISPCNSEGGCYTGVSTYTVTVEQ